MFSGYRAAKPTAKYEAVAYIQVVILTRQWHSSVACPRLALHRAVHMTLTWRCSFPGHARLLLVFLWQGLRSAFRFQRFCSCYSLPCTRSCCIFPAVLGRSTFSNAPFKAYSYLSPPLPPSPVSLQMYY